MSRWQHRNQWKSSWLKGAMTTVLNAQVDSDCHDVFLFQHLSLVYRQHCIFCVVKDVATTMSLNLCYRFVYVNNRTQYRQDHINWKLLFHKHADVQITNTTIAQETHAHYRHFHPSSLLEDFNKQRTAKKRSEVEVSTRQEKDALSVRPERTHSTCT